MIVLGNLLAPHTDVQPSRLLHFLHLNRPSLRCHARVLLHSGHLEEAVNTEYLLEIEKADSIKKTEAYRVYPIKLEALLEEGWEKESQEAKVKRGNSGIDFLNMRVRV